MKPNLDTLKDDILEALVSGGFAVFHGFGRHGEERPLAYWDTNRTPDFQPFLALARQTGIKTVIFNQLQFAAAMVDDAMDRLEDFELPLEERRGFERRLRELRAYQGFTCMLEMSFDSPARTYIYELQADWYSEFLRILNEIDSYAPDDEEDESSMGGYYSRN